MEGHWKFQGGGGVLENKTLEAKYEAELEFPGGEVGAKQKTFSGGSMDISGTAQCSTKICYILYILQKCA